MSDLVGNPEHRFSHNEAPFQAANNKDCLDAQASLLLFARSRFSHDMAHCYSCHDDYVFQTFYLLIIHDYLYAV